MWHIILCHFYARNEVQHDIVLACMEHCTLLELMDCKSPIKIPHVGPWNSHGIPRQTHGFPWAKHGVFSLGSALLEMYGGLKILLAQDKTFCWAHHCRSGGVFASVNFQVKLFVLQVNVKMLSPYCIGDLILSLWAVMKLDYLYQKWS